MSTDAVTRGPELEVAGLSKHFGGVVAVKDVTFAVDKGSITGLIGPNGAGKTTLLNLITGYLRPDGGHVRIAGHDLTGKRPHAVARAGVARTYQNLLLLDDEDVIENVRIGRHLADDSPAVVPWRSRESRRREREVLLELLDELGLADVATAPVASLPYGLRRRVEIARALATEPSVLILDEPTAGMTREESDDIASVVTGLRERGSTVLLVEHNVRLVTEICDEVLVLNWGELIGRETAAKVWDLEAVRTAYLGMSGEEVTDAVTGHPHERTSNAERH